MPKLHRPRHGILPLFLALIAFLFALPAASRCDALEEAARALAARVAALPRLPESAALAWENRSTLSEYQSDALRRAFIAGLSGGRLTFAANASAPVLRVTLTDTPARILLIAVLQPGEAQDAILMEVERAALPAEQGVSSAARLEKELLWRQPEPVLDGIEWAEAANQESFLLLLTRNSFLRLRSAKEGRYAADAVPLPGSLLLPWPREGAAGFVAVALAPAAQLKIRMNQKLCDVTLGEKPGLSCAAEAGETRAEPVIAASCNRASYRLLMGGADRTEKDWIQAAESAGGESGKLTARMDMPGPVVSVTPRREGNSAIAIVRNLLTGDYEVHRITLACGN